MLKQLMGVIMGLVIMVILSLIDYSWISNFQWIMYGGGAGTNVPFATSSKALKQYLKDSSKKLPEKELEEIKLD